jgi:N-acetylglucosaminyldiphosphoundecaprenol N-acetyl-beta-D-mannosaminyltransferase
MVNMETRPNSFSVLGVHVNAVQIPDVIARMQMWIESGEHGKCIAATGMHGIMEAHHDPAFMDILNSADLVIPDGTPLVKLARLKGLDLKQRVYGPDLMLAFCESNRDKQIRHFFYGGEPGVPEKLAQELSNRFPGLVIAGTYSPPFAD